MGYRLSSTYCRVRFKLRCFSLCTKIMHNEISQYIFSTEKFCARFKTIQFLNIRTLPSLPYVSFQYSSYEMIFSPAWFGGSHAKETLVAPFSNIRKLVGWPGTPCWVFTYNTNYSVFTTDGILQNRFTVSFYNPQRLAIWQLPAQGWMVAQGQLQYMLQLEWYR